MKTAIRQLVAGISIILLVAAAPAGAAISLDQNQPNGSSGVSLGLFIMHDLAQSFKQANTNVAGAGILMGSSSGYPVGQEISDTITIALYKNGLPGYGGTWLAEGSAEYTAPNPGEWLDVYWTPVSVTPDTTYYLVFTETDPSLFGIAGSGDTYPRGQLYAGTGFQPFPGNDYAFRTYYANIADAGEDISIYTSGQALTTIAGTATSSTPGTAMEYQWLEGDTVLKVWADVVDGKANLSLATLVPGLPIGTHTLTLEVKVKGATQVAASDTMTLTISNTPPEAQPSPTNQVREIGVDAIVIAASVADFDGGTVSYQWVKDGAVIESGTVTTPGGGTPVKVVPDLTIAAGDARFALGLNQVQLVVSDGVNPAVTWTVTIKMQDTTAPTLAPIPSLCMLWPPNHDLVPVTIWANGADKGDGVVLGASVQCSENDGLAEPDWYVDSIDNTAGTIAMRLRAERSQSDDGRVYTVTITATDASGNLSTATVDIRVPHDKKKR